MFHLRSALSDSPFWRDAVDECLEQVGDCDDVNLGFVYFSDHFTEDAYLLLEYLRGRSRVAHWAGSVAYGVCGRGRASIDQPALALLVGHFPEGSFHVFSGREPLHSAGGEHYFAVVHGDPRTPDMSELVCDMAGKVSSGFITGGLSSGRGGALQIANEVLSGGISGVAFSHEIGVTTRLTQGCLLLAGPFSITEGDDNLLYLLDDRPALDVFLEAAGNPPAPDLGRIAARVHVGLQMPGDDVDDYVVRHVVGVDVRNGVLAISERIEPGQRIVFCRRDAEAARHDMRRMLDGLKHSLLAPPQGGLYICCTARGGNMFGNDNAEMEMIRDTFGDVPISGFFAAGEIAKDRLYGYTGVLTLFT